MSSARKYSTPLLSRIGGPPQLALTSVAVSSGPGALSVRLVQSGEEAGPPALDEACPRYAKLLRGSPFPRTAAKPRPAKPRSIIAQVAGSGVALALEISIVNEFAWSPAPEV